MKPPAADSPLGEEALRRIFEYSNDAGFVLDPTNDRVVDANRRACELLGYTYEELMATPISVIHPTEMPRLLEFTNGVFREGSGWTRELTCTTKSRGRIPAEISASAVEIAGEPRIVAWVRDVSDRQRAEVALRESEERFRLLVEHAADAFYVLEEDGRIADFNQRACEQTGYTREELYSMRIWEISEGLNPGRFEQYVAQMRATGPITVGNIHRRKDGTRFPVEVRPCVFRLGDRWCVLALVRDVTDRVKSERERRQLALERGYLLEELQMERNRGKLVGGSPAMRKLFSDIARVAPTDSTVLITGETGTGKELVARAVHGSSLRKDKVLIKVNCAALPPTLIESELFGHEKGAFTGATARKAGRFELADGGTLFLDEIAELPLELQPKLLRVLQEGEFERVGGMRTLTSDVRLIAATNRDLQSLIVAKQFREDLYYRLNVFPVTLPPLRERRQDIPLLVDALVERYAKKLGKTVQTIPASVMTSLQAYHWPGNVRELENVIERALILMTGSTLDFNEVLPSHSLSIDTSSGPRSLEDVEREHILQTLETVNWQIEGRAGAAELLGLKASTLRDRIRKLGLQRPTTTTVRPQSP